MTHQRCRRHLPAEDRIDYVRAVKCLQKAPSAYHGVDSAKSRFEDFIIYHWNNTPAYHMSVSCSTLLALGSAP